MTHKTQNDYILNLMETVKLIEESLYWLKRSFDICQKIGIKEQYSEEEFDSFETLTSRFARLSDIIIHKAFRSIDKVELEDKGSLIDVLNRAHKRGLFDSVDKIRIIKDLRNSIAHEYATEELEEIFKEVLEHTPQIVTIIEKFKNYCHERYQSEDKT